MSTDNQTAEAGTQDASQSSQTSPATEAGQTSTEATGTQTTDTTQAATSTSDAADPLASVPEKSDGYAFKLSDKAQGLVGDLKDDPAVKALQDFAFEKKWTQGQFNTLSQALDALAEKGLIEPPIDQQAELAKLGGDGETRQKGLETYLQALQSRGEIDGEMFGEAMMLTRTAAGVKMLEMFKKAMPDVNVDTGGGEGGGDGQPADQRRAREMAADPRYKTDRAFKKEADALYMKAFS